MFRLADSNDYKKLKKKRKNRKTNERRKAKREQAPQNAMDVVKAVSDKRKKARHDKV